MNRNATVKLIRRALASPEALVHLDGGPVSIVGLEQAAAGKASFFWIDRAPVFDKVTVLHALYQGCRLPATFGFNWDALIDSLSSLPAAPAYILAFNDLAILQARDPASLTAFVQVLDAVRDRLAGRRQSFVVVYGGRALTA